MTTQEENQLICEKLLGWKPSPDSCNRWIDSRGAFIHVTPTFTTWADAGLILDALISKFEIELHYICDISYAGWKLIAFKIGIASRKEPFSFTVTEEKWFALGETGPLAIRAAALEYIRSLK